MDTQASWWGDQSEPNIWAVPFAIDKTGNVVDVEGVERGLACQCICPECGLPLVAKKGEFNRHHFAHHDRRECRDALDASVFRMVAAVLSKPGARVRIPGSTRRSEWLRAAGIRPGSGLYERSCRDQEWVIEPVDYTTVAGFKILCPKVSDSNNTLPDLMDEEAGLEVHLASRRKPAAALPNHPILGGSRVLGLHLGSFWSRWWSTCPEEANGALEHVGRSTTRLIDWLAKGEEGRALLFDQSLATARAKFDQWMQRNQRENRAPVRPHRFQRPAGRVSVQHATTSIPEYVPEQFVESAAQSCKLCGAPLDRVRLGSRDWPQDGRLALRCSKNCTRSYQLET